MKALVEAVVKGLADSTSSDSRRLFHGRGQCYPDLGYINVDWFSPVLLITLYQEPQAQDWTCLLEEIRAISSVVDCALVQQRYRPGAPMEVLWGQLPQQPIAMEQGLSYALSLGGKQNIGFFQDMAPGRSWIKQRARQKRVLNLFAYTCAFSVAAIDGGASSVLNVDMSSAALKVGRKNHQLNHQQTSLQRDVQFFPHDIFRSWKKISSRGPFDIVVIDPPSRQKGSFIAAKDYARVIRRLSSLTAAGGDILACLNAPELGDDFLHELFARQCPDADFVQRLQNRSDFPESDPRRNVKMLHYQMPLTNGTLLNGLE